MFENIVKEVSELDKYKGSKKTSFEDFRELVVAKNKASNENLVSINLDIESLQSGSGSLQTIELNKEKEQVETSLQKIPFPKISDIEDECEETTEEVIQEDIDKEIFDCYRLLSLTYLNKMSDDEYYEEKTDLQEIEFDEKDRIERYLKMEYRYPHDRVSYKVDKCNICTNAVNAFIKASFEQQQETNIVDSKQNYDTSLSDIEHLNKEYSKSLSISTAPTQTSTRQKLERTNSMTNVIMQTPECDPCWYYGTIVLKNKTAKENIELIIGKLEDMDICYNIETSNYLLKCEKKFVGKSKIVERKGTRILGDESKVEKEEDIDLYPVSLKFDLQLFKLNYEADKDEVVTEALDFDQKMYYTIGFYRKQGDVFLFMDICDRLTQMR